LTAAADSILVADLRQRPLNPESYSHDCRKQTLNSPPRHKILLAEDNAANQKIAHFLLTKLHCEVDLATTGYDTLAAARQQEYDLILMDCQMPDMDGCIVTRKIRSEPGPNRATAIIAFTANTTDSERDECLQAGMNEFASKPVSHTQLQRILAEWSRRKAFREALPC
jgi:CheY-like chemotaxis protein